MYDLAIIGAGPAGLTAAVYAHRYKMNLILIGKTPGGYVSDAHMVGNWLGETNIPGHELSKKFLNHVEDLEIPFEKSDVKDVEKKGNDFLITVSGGKEILAKRIIIATGTKRSKLNVKGEEEFLGKGVSYCATCDAFFYRKKTVAVIGGGDSALTAAIYLSDLAEKVYIIQRENLFTAEQIWQDKVNDTKNIESMFGISVDEIVGDKLVEKIKTSDGREILVNGIFVEIGSAPVGELIRNLEIKTDDYGYVVVNEKQETNVPGVWAAGDITTGSNKLKQIITAAAEGAIAANSCYMNSKKD